MCQLCLLSPVNKYTINAQAVRWELCRYFWHKPSAIYCTQFLLIKKLVLQSFKAAFFSTSVREVIYSEVLYGNLIVRGSALLCRRTIRFYRKWLCPHSKSLNEWCGYFTDKLSKCNCSSRGEQTHTRYSSTMKKRNRCAFINKKVWLCKFIMTWNTGISHMLTNAGT